MLAETVLEVHSDDVEIIEFSYVIYDAKETLLQTCHALGWATNATLAGRKGGARRAALLQKRKDLHGDAGQLFVRIALATATCNISGLPSLSSAQN